MRKCFNLSFFIFIFFFVTLYTIPTTAESQKKYNFFVDYGGRDLDRFSPGPVPISDPQKSHLDPNSIVVSNEDMISEIREIFYSAYDDYIQFAFPEDELDPVLCKGKSDFGGLALTLIDSLDTLAIMGNITEFEWAVQWLSENLSFEIDQDVSVFETNIRVLGGLLSAHMIAIDPDLPFFACDDNSPCYSFELLSLAQDLGERLFPAFQTKSGIPYGSINLLRGIPEGETTVTSTAGAGTFLLEFGLLSHLSGNLSYYTAAKRACKALYFARSPKDLLGNHIDFARMKWTHRDSGVGAGIDSYFEYLLKAAILFNDSEILEWFFTCFKAIKEYIWKGSWIYEANIDNGQLSWTIYNSLQSFWPGVVALWSSEEDFSASIKTLQTFYSVYSIYGFNPEGYNFLTGTPQAAQLPYPLRPELIESFYWHFRRTKDSSFSKHGVNMLQPFQKFSNLKTRISKFESFKNTLHSLETDGRGRSHGYKDILRSSCGFAGPNDVKIVQKFLANDFAEKTIDWELLSNLDSENHTQYQASMRRQLSNPPLHFQFRSTMESFFLAETLKYYYLLFDENNPFNSKYWLPTTEAHFIPVRTQYVLHPDYLTVSWASSLLDSWNEKGDDTEIPIQMKFTSGNIHSSFTCSIPSWDNLWFPLEFLQGNDLTSSFCLLY